MLSVSVQDNAIIDDLISIVRHLSMRKWNEWAGRPLFQIGMGGVANVVLARFRTGL
jgi:hypothetical protein